MDHAIAVVVVAVAAFISTVLLRMQTAEKKLGKLEEEKADDDITQKIHMEPDADLDLELSKDLRPRNVQHGQGD